MQLAVVRGTLKFETAEGEVDDGGRRIMQSTIRLSSYLLLWLVIFLAKTPYQVQDFYPSMLGPELFRNHEQRQRFVTRTSPGTTSVEGQVLFVWGGDPEVKDFNRLMMAMFFPIKYLLYPSRMSPHMTEGLQIISHIAVYQTREELFHQLPFCHQVGEGHFACQVRPANRTLQNYDVHVHYQVPDLTVTAQASEQGESDPAFLIASFKEFPYEHGFDLNLLLTKQSNRSNPPGQGGLYRQHLSPWAMPLPTYRFQLFIVDREGLFSAVEERRLVLTP